MSTADPGPYSNEAFFRERFRRDAHRLFQANGESKLESLRVAKDSNEIRKDCLRGSRDLAPNESVNDEHTFYVVRQRNTLDRFLVTLHVFEEILGICEPFTPYLDSLQAFGQRENDDEKFRSGYRWQRSVAIQQDEMCYNIRFVELNGRKSGDPWSLRQIGVYEKFNFQSRSSKWILLQPSPAALQALEDGLRSREHDLHSFTNSMSLHTRLLFTSSRQWPDYIDHLRAQLERLETKACYSAVGRKREFDYGVDFQDCQNLQRLRRKLITASDSICSNIKITAGCHARYLYMAKSHDLLSSDTFLEDVENHWRELQSHWDSIQTILKYSKGTARLLEKILQSRHYETVRQQSYDTARLSSDQKMATERIALLQEQTASDSKLLKSLTFLATLYLPASLIATIFSSSLVLREPKGQENDGLHFVIANDFWLYIAVMVPLTILTLLPILWSSW